MHGGALTHHLSACRNIHNASPISGQDNEPSGGEASEDNMSDEVGKNGGREGSLNVGRPEFCSCVRKYFHLVPS